MNISIALDKVNDLRNLKWFGICPCFHEYRYTALYHFYKGVNKIVHPCPTYPVKKKEQFLANRDSLVSIHVVEC